MNSAKSRVNDRTIGLCATVLRRIGPSTAKALSNELRESHGLDLTNGELSSMLRVYGKNHGVLSRRMTRYVKPLGGRYLVYYVAENRKTLGWWIE